MDTKLKADIVESAVVTELLKHDFVVYIQDLNDFFVLPVAVFKEYRSTLTLAEKKGAKVMFDRIKVKKYLNRWDLLMG